MVAVPRGSPSPNAGRFLIILAPAGLLIPLILAPFPPLLDYPNHYARLWLLAGGMDSPPLSEMYAADWSRASLNIGIDVVASTLGRVVGKESIPTLMLGCAIVLAPIGGIALHRRLIGQLHWWQIAFCFPAWSMTLLAGFMNFHIGLGLAMIAAAVDHQVVKLGKAAAFTFRALFCAVALMCHPFAGLFYAGLIVALSYGLDLGTSWRDVGKKAPSVLLAVLAVLTPVIVILLFSRNAPVGVLTKEEFFAWAPLSIPKKVSLLASGVRSYSMALDGLALVALITVPALAALQRRLAIHYGLLILSALFAVVACCMPTRIGQTYWMDYRLPIMALFAFMLAIRPNLAPTWVAHLAASVLLILTISRTAVVANYWIMAQDDLASVRRAISAVPAGAAVLTLMNVPSKVNEQMAPTRYVNGKANFWNYGTLVIPWRQAFAPNLFSAAGQQPLRVLPGWADISAPFSPPPAISELYAKDHEPLFAYVSHWRTKFDYVLLLNADLPDKGGALLPMSELRLVRKEGFAALYKIRRTSAAAPAANVASLQ